MFGALYRRVVFPAYHGFKRDGINRAIRELEHSQWTTTEALYELQMRKLALLLAEARAKVPYYKVLFEQNGIKLDRGVLDEEFRKIPPLTKDVIRREQNNLVNIDFAESNLIPNSTSGSTGDPIRFYTDRRSDPYRRAAGFRSVGWTGWRIGDRRASLWGSPIDQARSERFRSKVHALITGTRFLSSFDLSDEKLDDYVELIRKFRPVILEGYSGPLEHFARHCRERKVELPSIKAIISSAETLWPHQRSAIEESFGVKVFDRYGSREVGQIAAECEKHNGLHISAERQIVENLDENGQPCGPGEIGRLYVTDLDNFGMPLIRYDIGDRGVAAESEICSCGRGLPLLARIEGRSLEVVITADGHRIGGTFWTLLLRSRPAFHRFQVVQKELRGVDVRFVRAPDFQSDSLGFFERKIKERCGRDFRVTFTETDSIDSSKSGKQRLIVSDVS